MRATEVDSCEIYKCFMPGDVVLAEVARQHTAVIDSNSTRHEKAEALDAQLREPWAERFSLLVPRAMEAMCWGASQGIPQRLPSLMRSPCLVAAA